MPTTSRPSSAHPVLGQPVRLVIHRYQPDVERNVTSPEEVAAFVRVFAETHVATHGTPRAMPAVEVVFYDAAGAPLANALFLDADGAGYLNVRDRGTRTLSEEESRALRELLARSP